MSHWTWMDWAGVVLWAADISLWGVIGWMHVREHYAALAEQKRLARKARLDAEKMKPSAATLRQRAEASVARRVAAQEIARIKENAR